GALLISVAPPEIDGGAGVHVEYLSKELTRLLDVEVHCFGAPRDSNLVAAAYQPWEALDSRAPHEAALRTMSVNLLMASRVSDVDVAHSHTWYANFPG